MHKFLKLIFGIKLYVFRTVPLSIIRSFDCTHSNGICRTGLVTACEQAVIRSFSLQTHQWYVSYRFGDSLRASCHQTCMTYTIAVYIEKLLMMDRGTVRNT